MNIAVVGGGWAGLAAALALHDGGASRVTVFEAAPRPGGRARYVEHADFPAGLDNGQHLLLGAYTACLALIQRLHGDADALLWRHPLRLESLDGTFRLALSRRLPAPLHALAGLLGAQGLSMRARWQACRLMHALRAARWHTQPGWTVDELLYAHGQEAEIRQKLWRPLCLAALNTPSAQACAALFAAVLRDSVAGSHHDSDLLLPRTDLGSLWPEAAIASLDWRPGKTVREIRHLPEQGIWHVNGNLGEPFQAVILAVPPPQALQLLQPLPAAPTSHALLAALAAFDFEAIATLNLHLAHAWRLPLPMMQLDDRGGTLPGQWVFDRAWLTRHPNRGELSIVSSVASPFLDQGRDALAAAMETQWREQAARRPGLPAAPRTLARALIVEKRATFQARPGLHRPGNASPWPGLLLAGDWTDTGYPGVLEGAVRSGQAAAARLLG